MADKNTDPIKRKLNSWLHEHIHKMRRDGLNPTKSFIAKTLGVSKSSFSQYTNPDTAKKAPWEFQCKLCFILGKSIEDLHPEITGLSRIYLDTLAKKPV
jgi:DNA-binding XRE family transcriptional regulator